MRSRLRFPRAVRPLDLSRNYYLREDGTLEGFPVEVIELPGPPAPPPLYPHSTGFTPPPPTTSVPPKSTTTRRSKSTTTAPLSPHPPSERMTGQTKNPRAAKGKAKTSNVEDSKNKEKAAIIFDEILHQIYANPENASKTMNKAADSGWLKDQQRKQQEEAISHEPKEKKKRGRPPGMSKNPEKRKLEEQSIHKLSKKKGKGGWKKGMPRNLEKRKIWEQKQLMAEDCQQQEGPQTRKKMRKDYDLPESANEVQEEDQEAAAEEEQQEQPQTAEELQQDEPIARAPEESKGKTGSNKAAIIAGLTGVMLQMTKITADVARLMAMASGGCEDD